MKHELLRIDPLRAANIVGVIQGAMMFFIILIFSPFFLIAALLGSLESSGLGMIGTIGGVGIFLLLLILYPIMGLVFGWITGLGAALAFNLVTRWTGGLIVETRNAAGFEPVVKT